MLNKLYPPVYFIGENMKQISDIINELKGIMQLNSISQNSVINALDGKCSRQTILNFFKGDADCKVSTFLMIIRAVGAEIRIDTEMSKEAIMSGDIAAYRSEAETLRAALEDTAKALEEERAYNSDLKEKNAKLTNTVEKQQNQIDRYIDRMEKAEQNIYRKDERIVELSKRLGLW